MARSGKPNPTSMALVRPLLRQSDCASGGQPVYGIRIRVSKDVTWASPSVRPPNPSMRLNTTSGFWLVKLRTSRETGAFAASGHALNP